MLMGSVHATPAPIEIRLLGPAVFSFIFSFLALMEAKKIPGKNVAKRISSSTFGSSYLIAILSLNYKKDLWQRELFDFK